MKKRILFGTNNLHKLREIREILSETYEVLSLADVQLDMDVEETEPDLVGNAILKARAFSEASGMPCFADDTGLEVTALGGKPGVRTARYAGEHATFQDNIDKLLREMQGKTDRSAAFRTVIAYVNGEQVDTFEGKVEGAITQAASGQGGFGYDPVFAPEGKDVTFAEMSPEDKNAISHRGRAVRKFTDFLLS
ncbi:MAG: RdgB/HAM1 family non-canonical purine NTP pyrophosphatase [Bacteroidota bacterium]